MTGKAELGAASRLCKQSLFRQFFHLVDHLPIPDTLTSIENIKSELYSLLKAKNQDYQASKT